MKAMTINEYDLYRWMRRNGREPKTAERIASGCLAYLSATRTLVAACRRDLEALEARGVLVRHKGEPPRWSFVGESTEAGS